MESETFTAQGMMTDGEIAAALDSGEIGIYGIEDRERQIQPCSVDLRIDNSFQLFDTLGPIALGESMRERMLSKKVAHDGVMRLMPGQFVLGVTKERVRLPANIFGRVEGRSSIGRMGLFVHVTAGFIDPGFEGAITLELFNAAPVPIDIPVGFRICQLSIYRLATACVRPYGSERGSKYVGGAAESVQPAKGESR